MLRISHLTTEYVKAPVSAEVNGVAVDLSGDTVTVAFKKPGVDPSGGDFSSASWETDATTSPTTYLARRLVTTGDLAVGQWVMWVKVVHGAETMVRDVGMLTVT